MQRDSAYPFNMSKDADGKHEQRATASTSEDWRGVDVAQIRRQLRMTPAERLDYMTQVANRMRKMQAAARRGG